MLKRNIPKPESHPLARRNPKADGQQVKFKTEICRKWETGQCEFGSKCAFAHGVDELKKKDFIPKNYKTTLCKPFFEKGYCLYGPRCQFSHDLKSEKKTAPSTPVKSRCNSEEASNRRLPIFIQLGNKS